MTTYKSNLLDRLEGLSDTVKWGIVACAVLGAVLVVVFGVRGAHHALRLVQMQEAEPVEQTEAPPVQQAVQAQPEPAPAQQAPQREHRPAPARPKPPAQPEDTTRYLSELDGYAINGIMLLEGAPPEVLLKKGGDIRSYRVGDAVAGYTVKSIHRHHIILERGKDRVHLNRVQF